MKGIFLTLVLMLALGAIAATSPILPPSQLNAQSTTTPTPAPTPTPSSRTANIKEIINLVQARGSAEKNFESANVGLTLNVGGQARTGDNSKARLDFVEGSIVRLGPNTILTVEELGTPDGSPLTRFQMELGKLWISLFGGTLNVKTPAGLVSVRGSFATLEVFADGRARFALLEGRGGFGNTNLTNMQGLVIQPDGKIAQFEVPQEFVVDFCDNNPETCKALLGLLYTNTPQIVPEIVETEPESLHTLRESAPPESIQAIRPR